MPEKLEENVVKKHDSGARKGPDLRKLKYSPEANPLVEGASITVRKRHVRTGLKSDMANIETGEVSASSIIHTIEEVDDAQFVKVFAAGVKAIYELSRTATRVFQVILDHYQREPMNGGFADSIYLAWFDKGLSGQSIGMSEDTYSRGLKELLAKGFIAPRQPNLFWVNPSLFFKGDRALFLKEYRRKSEPKGRKPLDVAVRDELEKLGQRRLVE